MKTRENCEFIPNVCLLWNPRITSNSLAVEFLMKTLNEILPLEIESSSDNHCSMKPWGPG